MSQIRLQNHLQAIPVLFVIVCLKGFDRLIHARVWAEDGTVFLTQAYELGWSSLLQPYAGYFHTVPRLTALVAILFPIPAVPTLLVLINYLLFAAIISTLLKEGYRYLFPNKKYAYIAVLLLLLSPGQFSMLGNSTNLHWYLLFYLAVLGIKDIRTTNTLAEYIAAMLCIVSEGAVIILLPLFITRIVLVWKQENFWKKSCGNVFIAASILVVTVVNYTIRTGESSTSMDIAHLKIFFIHLMSFVFLHPFVGDDAIIELQKFNVPLFLLGGLAAIIAGYIWYKNWKKEHLLLLVLLGCACCLPVMIAMARVENANLLRSFFNYNEMIWFSFRYSFFIPAVAAVFWVFLLQFAWWGKWGGRFLLSWIVLCQLISGQDRMIQKRYGLANDWSKRADQLEKVIKTGDPSQVKIDIYPQGWYVIIRSPHMLK